MNQPDFVVDLSCHCLTNCRFLPSPNANARPAGLPDLIVLHNISLPPNQFGNGLIEKLFLNQLTLDENSHWYLKSLQGLEVSAHLLIARDGAVTQFVAFDRRAWHAGKSQFLGRENCNDYSIGIELEGADVLPFTKIQYQQLNRIIAALTAAYRHITPARIVAHSHIAPARKTDPGPFFNWQQLAFLEGQS